MSSFCPDKVIHIWWLSALLRYSHNESFDQALPCSVSQLIFSPVLSYPFLAVQLESNTLLALIPNK